MLRCTGCGSTETIEQIRERHPHALSCCPERDVVDDVFVIKALKREGYAVVKVPPGYDDANKFAEDCGVELIQI